MFNPKYLPQIEKFRRYLAKWEEAPGVSLENVEILQCYEDVNGEWVPFPVEPVSKSLEERTDSE